MTRAAALVALAFASLPAVSHAQTVYVAPAPEVSVTVPTPPAPPAYPPPNVYVAPPRVYAPPPPRVYIAPPRPRVYMAPTIGAVPPHVYIRERVRWHFRRAARWLIGAPLPPPPVVVAAPLPPPVIEVQPAAPIPPPIVVAPPCCCSSCQYAPPPPPPVAPQVVVVTAPRPVGWSSRFGLGVRGTGQVVSDNWNNVGIGGELLYRASNHVSLELAAEYQKNAGGYTDRMDVPVTAGLRLHIGNPNWIVSPYFVFAAGFDYANQDLRVTQDQGYYFDGQLGGGLEFRVGQHFAITADGRFDGKKRIDQPSDAVVATTSVNGKAVHALGDEYGGQFRLGLAVYF